MPNSALQIPSRLAIAMIDSGNWCLRNDIIWYKRNGQPNTSPSRFGLGDYEHIYFFTKQSAGYYFKPQYEPFTPATAAEGKQKHTRQVWDIPTQPSKESHYSQFPPALCNICINAGCPESGVVLDPFMGSGTTGISSLRNNRQFIGIDSSPEYVAIAEKRLREVTSGLLASDRNNNDDNDNGKIGSTGANFTLDDLYCYHSTEKLSESGGS
jgi:DNA modification methylase